MTVLVTGGNGFLGRVIVRHLDDAGYEVRIASRYPDSTGKHEAVALPPPDAPDAAFRGLLKDVIHVVHCAALNSAARDATLADYMKANSTLTGRLAEAAADMAPGRFVFLSSIRAVVGAGYAGTVDEQTEAMPACAYGRSKRAGEMEAAARYAPRRKGDLTILRLPPVYGEGMKGLLATLMRLADTAVPLPFAGLAGRRSVVSSSAAGRAVSHLLGRGKFRQTYVAGDLQPVTIPEILEAYRKGFSRSRRLFHAPSALLASAAALAGRSRDWESLSATQVCDPSALASTGWTPEADSLAGLEAIARRQREARS